MEIGFTDLESVVIQTTTKKKDKKGTYNTRDSLVVTDPTTNLAVSGLALGERTGPRVLQILWSYVLECGLNFIYNLGT